MWIIFGAYSLCQTGHFFQCLGRRHCRTDLHRSFITLYEAISLCLKRCCWRGARCWGHRGLRWTMWVGWWIQQSLGRSIHSQTSLCSHLLVNIKPKSQRRITRTGTSPAAALLKQHNRYRYIWFLWIYPFRLWLAEAREHQGIFIND